MVFQLDPSTFLPWAASGYAWRWNDPNQTVLPSEVLASIRTLPVDQVQGLCDPSLRLDEWARDAPDRTIDVESEPPEEVVDWLLGLLPEGSLAVLLWSGSDAVALPWGMFAKYWDAFWYGSSDDLTVFSVDEDWALACHHEGLFSWRQRS